MMKKTKTPPPDSGMQVTQSLNKLLHQFVDRGVPRHLIEDIIDRVQAQRHHWNRGVKQGLNPVDMYKVILQSVDDAIAQEVKKYDGMIKCRKGCAFCCHINVDVSQVEVDLLLQYVKKHRLEIDWERVEKQAPLDNDQRMLSEHSRCVFLGDDNACQVYEARPLSCRKYFVVSDPALCNGKEHPHGEVASPAMLQPEIVASALGNTNQPQGNLSALLLKSRY